MDPNNTMAGTPGEQNNNAVPETAVSETATSAASGSAPSEAAVEMQAAMVADQIANPVEPPKENIMAEGNGAKKKSGKGMMIAVALLALVALGGIGFGVWAMMDGNSQTKTLNDQISSLKKTNNELMEQLSEANANADDGGDTIIDIDTSNDYGNPVIASSNSSERYTINFGATGIALGDGNNKRISINVTEGDISGCQIYNGNSLVSECEITGISGKIYNVINFGEGQALDENNGIGFIMTDGTVEYIPLIQAMENDDYSIKGKLNIDGYVVNAFGIGVGFEISEGAYGGYVSTVFVLRDGSFVKFDKSMLD